MAERGVVVLAGVDHQPVVFGGQGGVDAAGLPGGHEQCLPQDRVAAFGRAAVSIVHTGSIEGGNQAGEGSGAGEGGEPVRVAEPSENRGCGDRGDAGCGGEDAGRVGFTQQQCGRSSRSLISSVSCSASLASMAMSSARSG